MTMISSDVLAQIDALLLGNAAALDRKDMKGWADTFSIDADASYLCVTAESHEAGLSLALIMDDCRSRIEDRVMFITKMWAGTFQDYRTRHFVQRFSCAKAEDGLYDVQSNFMMAFTPSDTGRAELFAAGLYVDRVKVDEGGTRLHSRKVITDMAVLPQYMVYPL